MLLQIGIVAQQFDIVAIVRAAPRLARSAIAQWQLHAVIGLERHTPAFLVSIGCRWQQVTSIIIFIINIIILIIIINRLAFLPAALQRLSNLRILTLRNNELRTLPRHMTRLGALKELTISDNRLTDVGGLCSLVTFNRY